MIAIRRIAALCLPEMNKDAMMQKNDGGKVR
jgi:hypothetical protein